MSDPAWRGTGLAAVLLLAGCAAGPDYVAPGLPTTARFTLADPSVIRSGTTLAPQDVRRGAVLPDRWWESFGNRDLDEVVDRALAASPTLEAARATLAQARHELATTRGALTPRASLSAA